MQDPANAAAAATLDADEVFATLRGIVCEILILKPEQVQLSSKLVDDLDADSIAFLELSWRIRNDFGLEVPQAKVDEETLTMPLLEGVEKLERAMGGTTLFEFMQREATRGEADNPFALLGGLAADAPSRERASRMKLSELAQQMGSELPPGFAPEAAISTLRLRDLFRFITMQSYVRYVLYLAASQQRIREMGGADAMNAEVTARLRQGA